MTSSTLFTLLLCVSLCSAGVGRTGTFIALDITLDQMKAEKKVDIKGTVEKMRENRMYMIQTLVCEKHQHSLYIMVTPK